MSTGSGYEGGGWGHTHGQKGVFKYIQLLLRLLSMTDAWVCLGMAYFHDETLHYTNNREHVKRQPTVCFEKKVIQDFDKGAVYHFSANFSFLRKESKLITSLCWPCALTPFFDIYDSTFSRQSAHRWRWVVSLASLPPFTPRKIPGTHFCYRLSRPRAIVRQESNDLMGNRTRDIQACSTVLPVLYEILCKSTL
jgi:hypothetical protein